MLFNSYEFLIFLPLVWIVYWRFLQGRLYLQNCFVLLASYVFYGWWDWRFLSLIVLSSLVDFITGIKIHDSESKQVRKYWLWLSVAVNIGILGVFKYYNFFVENFVELMDGFGIYTHPFMLDVVLPVGVSFYTFQTLSYTIDVYERRIEPTRDWVAFFSFVSFFPQLVAGPIERARHLLPQFYKPRTFDYRQSVDGLRQMLWGMFKKVVLADTIAPSVDHIFGHYHEMSGAALVLGGVLFSFQIYGDFSGYSDIAIGSARLFGFDLKPNFRTPFYSKGAFDLVRRWHISLNTWFRDYFYKYIKGKRKGVFIQAFGTFLTFLASGLWHGAAWNFVAWGALWGGYFMQAYYYRLYVYPHILLKNKVMRQISSALLVLKTYGFIVLSLIVFRTVNFNHMMAYLAGIFDFENFWELPSVIDGRYHWLFMSVTLLLDYVYRKKRHSLQIEGLPKLVRWIIYIVMTIFILHYFGTEQSFIYFQF